MEFFQFQKLTNKHLKTIKGGDDTTTTTDVEEDVDRGREIARENKPNHIRE